jgi:hypothetical protein
VRHVELARASRRREVTEVFSIQQPLFERAISHGQQEEEHCTQTEALYDTVGDDQVLSANIEQIT